MPEPPPPKKKHINQMYMYKEDLVLNNEQGFICHKTHGLAVRVFANGPGDLGSIPGRVIPKTLKNGTWYHLA